MKYQPATCGFSALCYAEFKRFSASRRCKAYTYALRFFSGELIADYWLGSVDGIRDGVI